MDKPSKANPVLWNSQVNRVDMITHLYNRMKSIFLELWDKNFTGGDEIENWKKEWAYGLRDFSADEVKRAIEKCHDLRWPPTLGGFKNLCRPEPDYETLFNEACRECGKHAALRKWSSRMAYHGANVFGHFELKNATWSAAKTRWTKIIDELRAVGDLDPIPEFHEQLSKSFSPDMQRINHYLADLHRIVGNQERAKELGQ